jgi:hypothetical protein
MKDIQYTAPNDFRAFCEMLEETGTSMAHHGIKGQHWGVRRFQNEDGTYTEAGKKRYFKNAGDRIKSLKEKITGKPVEQTKTPEEIRNRSRLTAAQAKLDAQPLKYNTKYTVRDPVIKKTISAFDELTKVANTVGGDYKNTKLKTTNDVSKDKVKLLALAGAGAGLGALSGIPMKFEHLEAQAPIRRFWTTNLNGQVIPHWNTYVPEPKVVRERSGVYIGTAAVAGAALSIGGYLGLSKIRAHKAEVANKRLQDVENEIRNNKNKDPKTGLKLIKGEHSLEEDLSKINPAFNNLSKTTKNNCINCVVSMALRRKGYDVNAGGETILGKHSALFTEMFPKCKLEYTKNNGDGSSFISKITKMSPESWGYCGTQFKDGGGHAMMYMVKNGKFTLMDPQSGKIYSDSQTKKILSKSSGIDYARLDDVSPDIKKCISRGTIDMAPYAEQTVKNAQRHGMQDIQRINQQQMEETQRINQQQMEETQRINQQQMEETQRINQQQVQQQIQQQMMFTPSFMMFGKKRPGGKSSMRHDIYTAPNDFRAFCEMLNETNDTMTHYGIRGQKRGFRRFQNEDGSLTPAGKERYGVGNAKHKDVIRESGQGWEHRTVNEKSAIKKTNQKAHAMQDAKAAYKAEKKAFKQINSEKAKEMDKKVYDLLKIKDRQKRNAEGEKLDKEFDKLWSDTRKRKAEVKAAKQEYKNAKKELHNDVQYAKAKSNNRIRATAAVGLTAAIATGLITKNTDKTTYARNAAIGATAVAALLGGHAVNKAKRATDPSIDLTRKGIKNANERQLNEKERTNSKKWVKAGLLAGAAGGAAALGVKKYGGLATDSGKKALAGGAALGLAGLATMERAAINDARIERQRKKLNKQRSKK